MNRRYIILYCCMLLLLSSCSTAKPVEEKVEPIVDELSLWVPEWNWEESMNDAVNSQQGLDRLQIFGAYFDPNDRLFFTPKMDELLDGLWERLDEGSAVDLTIVNDQFINNTVNQKDSDLLARLMSTEQARAEHIDQIMEIMLAYPFDGLEVDYERVQEEQWPYMLLFFEELYTRLKAEEKSMRIVLEPRTPMDKLALPVGPTYVVMAYNLFGTHSGPGPKADFEFLKSLFKKMSSLPGDPAIAFSTGGFIWSNSEGVKSVTEVEAEQLRRLSKQEGNRDESSGSVSFQYNDPDGNNLTIWYADDRTLSGWVELARKYGFSNFSFWRSGGLSQKTISKIRNSGF